MSRSAADATRFTATSPHAYSKPTPLRSTASAPPSKTTPPYRFPNPNAPRKPSTTTPSTPPQTETPAEKVARLRAARLAQIEAQTTTWDRIVLRGRVWADRAHRVTVYTILGFSAIAICVTGFALTDMFIHNRRKRAAFYAEQHALYATRVMEAIEAEKAGQDLDDDQRLVLNRERARVTAEEAKKERSWRKRAKGWLVGGLKGDEEEGKGELVVPSEGEVLGMVGVGESDVMDRMRGEREERRDGSGILEAVEEKRREVERSLEEREVRGGPLDRVAEEAVEKMKGKGGWMSWGKGG